MATGRPTDDSIAQVAAAAAAAATGGLNEAPPPAGGLTIVSGDGAVAAHPRSLQDALALLIHDPLALATATVLSSRVTADAAACEAPDVERLLSATEQQRSRLVALRDSLQSVATSEVQQPTNTTGTVHSSASAQHVDPSASLAVDHTALPAATGRGSLGSGALAGYIALGELALHAAGDDAAAAMHDQVLRSMRADFDGASMMTVAAASTTRGYAARAAARCPTLRPLASEIELRLAVATPRLQPMLDVLQRSLEETGAAANTILPPDAPPIRPITHPAERGDGREPLAFRLAEAISFHPVKLPRTVMEIAAGFGAGDAIAVFTRHTVHYCPIGAASISAEDLSARSLLPGSNGDEDDGHGWNTGTEPPRFASSGANAFSSVTCSPHAVLQSFSALGHFNGEAVGLVVRPATAAETTTAVPPTDLDEAGVETGRAGVAVDVVPLGRAPSEHEEWYSPLAAPPLSPGMPHQAVQPPRSFGATGSWMPALPTHSFAGMAPLSHGTASVANSSFVTPPPPGATTPPVSGTGGGQRSLVACSRDAVGAAVIFGDGRSTMQSVTVAVWQPTAPAAAAVTPPDQQLGSPPRTTLRLIRSVQLQRALVIKPTTAFHFTPSLTASFVTCPSEALRQKAAVRASRLPAMTVELWCRPTALATEPRALFSLGHRDVDEVFISAGADGHDGIVFRGGHRTPRQGTVAAAVELRFGDGATHRWFHVALSYDGRAWTLVVDGHRTASAAARRAAPDWAAAPGTTQLVWALGGGFTGYIAHARMWERARSAPVVARDMRRLVDPADLTLVLDVPLRDGIGVTALDRSRNRHHARLVHAGVSAATAGDLPHPSQCWASSASLALAIACPTPGEEASAVPDASFVTPTQLAKCRMAVSPGGETVAFAARATPAAPVGTSGGWTVWEFCASTGLLLAERELPNSSFGDATLLGLDYTRSGAELAVFIVRPGEHTHVRVLSLPAAAADVADASAVLTLAGRTVGDAARGIIGAWASAVNNALAQAHCLSTTRQLRSWADTLPRRVDDFTFLGEVSAGDLSSLLRVASAVADADNQDRSLLASLLLLAAAAAGRISARGTLPAGNSDAAGISIGDATDLVALLDAAVADATSLGTAQPPSPSAPSMGSTAAARRSPTMLEAEEALRALPCFLPMRLFATATLSPDRRVARAGAAFVHNALPIIIPRSQVPRVLLGATRRRSHVRNPVLGELLHAVIRRYKAPSEAHALMTSSKPAEFRALVHQLLDEDHSRLMTAVGGGGGAGTASASGSAPSPVAGIFDRPSSAANSNVPSPSAPGATGSTTTAVTGAQALRVLGLLAASQDVLLAEALAGAQGGPKGSGSASSSSSAALRGDESSSDLSLPDRAVADVVSLAHRMLKAAAKAISQAAAQLRQAVHSATPGRRGGSTPGLRLAARPEDVAAAVAEAVSNSYLGTLLRTILSVLPALAAEPNGALQEAVQRLREPLSILRDLASQVSGMGDGMGGARRTPPRQSRTPPSAALHTPPQQRMPRNESAAATPVTLTAASREARAARASPLVLALAEWAEHTLADATVLAAHLASFLVRSGLGASGAVAATTARGGDTSSRAGLLDSEFLFRRGLQRAGATASDVASKSIVQNVGAAARAFGEWQASCVSPGFSPGSALADLERALFAGFANVLGVATSTPPPSTVPRPGAPPPAAPGVAATALTFRAIYKQLQSLRPWLLASRQSEPTFLDEVRSRALLLCRLEPAVLAADAVEQAANRAARKRHQGGKEGSGSPSGPNGGALRSGSAAARLGSAQSAHAAAKQKEDARAWRAVFAVWKAVKRVRGLMSLLQGDDGSEFGISADRDAARTACLVAMSQFLRQRDTTAKEIEWAISSRVPAAQHRHVGLLALHDLLQASGPDDCIPCVAVVASKALGGRHVLDGILGAGADVVGHVRSALFGILGETLRKIGVGHRHTATLQLAAALLATPWLQGDFLQWPADGVAEVLLDVIRGSHAALSRSLASLPPPFSRSREPSAQLSFGFEGGMGNVAASYDAASFPRRERAALAPQRPSTPPNEGSAAAGAGGSSSPIGFMTPPPRRRRGPSPPPMPRHDHHNHSAPSAIAGVSPESPSRPASIFEPSPPPPGRTTAEHSPSIAAPERLPDTPPEDAIIGASPREVRVGNDGLTVRWVSGRGTVVGSVEWLQSLTAAATGANLPTRYFEVTIIELSATGSVAVGLGPRSYNLARPPGWDARSCALNSDDGALCVESSSGRPSSASFGVGSTVGCGLNPMTHEVFWTIDGRPCAARVPGFLYDCTPMVGMDLKGAVRINFGARPFALLDSHAAALGVPLRPRAIAAQARDALGNVVVRLGRALASGVTATPAVRGCTTRTLVDLAAEATYMIDALVTGAAIPAMPAVEHLLDVVALGATVVAGISRRPADASAVVLDACGVFFKACIRALVVLDDDSVRFAAWRALEPAASLLAVSRMDALLKGAAEQAASDYPRASCEQGSLAAHAPPSSLLRFALAEGVLAFPAKNSLDDLSLMAARIPRRVDPNGEYPPTADGGGGGAVPLSSPHAALGFFTAMINCSLQDETSATFTWGTAAADLFDELCNEASMPSAVAVGTLAVALGGACPPLARGSRVVLARSSWKHTGTRTGAARARDRWVVTRLDNALGVVDLVSAVEDGPPVSQVTSLNDVEPDPAARLAGVGPIHQHRLESLLKAAVRAIAPLQQRSPAQDGADGSAAGSDDQVPAVGYGEASLALRVLRCVATCAAVDEDATIAAVLAAQFLPVVQHFALLHALPGDFDAANFEEQEAALTARLLGFPVDAWPAVTSNPVQPEGQSRALRLVGRVDTGEDMDEARQRMAQELSMRGYSLEMCAIALEETHYSRTGALRLLAQHHDDMLRYLDDALSGDDDEEEEEEEECMDDDDDDDEEEEEEEADEEQPDDDDDDDADEDRESVEGGDTDDTSEEEEEENGGATHDRDGHHSPPRRRGHYSADDDDDDDDGDATGTSSGSDGVGDRDPHAHDGHRDGGDDGDRDDSIDISARGEDTLAGDAMDAAQHDHSPAGAAGEDGDVPEHHESPARSRRRARRPSQIDTAVGGGDSANPTAVLSPVHTVSSADSPQRGGRTTGRRHNYTRNRTSDSRGANAAGAPRGAVFDAGLLRVTCRSAWSSAGPRPEIGPYFTVDVLLRLSSANVNQVVACYGSKHGFHMALGVFEEHACFGISRGAHPLAWCALPLSQTGALQSGEWVRVTCSNTMTDLFLTVGGAAATSTPVLPSALPTAQESTGQWTIGAHEDGSAHMLGAMRELSIWNAGTADVALGPRAPELRSDQLLLRCKFGEGAPPIINSAPAATSTDAAPLSTAPGPQPPRFHVRIEIVGRLTWLVVSRPAAGDAGRFTPVAEVDLTTQLDATYPLYELDAQPDPFDRAAAWRSAAGCSGPQVAFGLTETTSQLASHYALTMLGLLLRRGAPPGVGGTASLPALEDEDKSQPLGSARPLEPWAPSATMALTVRRLIDRAPEWASAASSPAAQEQRVRSFAQGIAACVAVPGRDDAFGAVLLTALSVLASPPDHLVFESAHPAKTPSEPPREVSAPGVRGYHVYFDRHTGSGSSSAHLTFYGDPTLSQVCGRAAVGAFHPFAVPLPRFYYDVRLDGPATQWGYRMVITCDPERLAAAAAVLEALLAAALPPPGTPESQPSAPSPLSRVVLRKGVVTALLRCICRNVGATRRHLLRIGMTLLDHAASFPPQERFDVVAATLEFRRAFERQFRRESTSTLRSAFVQASASFLTCVKAAQDTWTPPPPPAPLATSSPSEACADQADAARSLYVRYRQCVRDMYAARDVTNAATRDRVGLVLHRFSDALRVTATTDRAWTVTSDVDGAVVACAVPFTRGRWYFEVKIVATGVASPSHSGSGGASSGTPMPLLVGFLDPTDCHRRDGALLSSTHTWATPIGPNGHGPSGTLGALKARDIVGVFFDVDARQASFRVNGQPLPGVFGFGDPAREAGRADAAGDNAAPADRGTHGSHGSTVPALALALGQSVTINFGTTHFDFEPPAGALPVDPTQLDVGALVPLNHLRAFRDAAAALLQGRPLPPYFTPDGNPFESITNARRGPPATALAPCTPGTLTVTGSDVRNNGRPFSSAVADCVLLSGRWYFEATLQTAGAMQLGWCCPSRFAPNPSVGRGVGDDEGSVAVDLFRRTTFAAGQAEPVAGSRRWSVGDVVGCGVDVDARRFLFTLNGNVVAQIDARSFGVSLSGGVAPAVTLRSGSGVEINLGATPMRFKPEGFRPPSVPDTWMERVDAFYNCLAGGPDQSQHQQLVRAQQIAWSSSSSSSSLLHSTVVQLVDAICASEKCTMPQVDLAKLAATTELSALPEPVGPLWTAAVAEARRLEAAPAADDRDGAARSTTASTAVSRVLDAYRELRLFDRLLQTTVPLTAGAGGDSSTSDALSLILRSRPFAFASTREALAADAVRETALRGEDLRVTLNRSVAASPEAESNALRTLFGQTFLVLRAQHPRLFRVSGRFWTVVFAGEGAEDVGGPFREHLSAMVAELQRTPPAAAQADEAAATQAANTAGPTLAERIDAAPSAPWPLALFVPTPNQQHNTGENRDSLVPNPAYTAAVHLDMYRFVGCLLGGAIRCGEPLGLALAPHVWKFLVGEPLTEADLVGFDALCAQCIAELRQLRSQGETARETFDEAFATETFTTQLSGGMTVDLVPGGAELPVTFSTCDAYLAALIRARLEEALPQLVAIRNGLRSVIPATALALRKGRELERAVCGQPDFTAEELREATTLEGLSWEAPRVVNFFKLVAEMSAAERRMLLRFVSGRERMPIKLRILPLQVLGDPNAALPRAATCFFALELPDYGSHEALRAKLLFAIANCIEIDTDFRARDGPGEGLDHGPMLTIGTDDRRPEAWGVDDRRTPVSDAD